MPIFSVGVFTVRETIYVVWVVSVTLSYIIAVVFHNSVDFWIPSQYIRQSYFCSYQLQYQQMKFSAKVQNKYKVHRIVISIFTTGYNQFILVAYTFKYKL